MAIRTPNPSSDHSMVKVTHAPLGIATLLEIAYDGRVFLLSTFYAIIFLSNAGFWSMKAEI